MRIFFNSLLMFFLKKRIYLFLHNSAVCFFVTREFLKCPVSIPLKKYSLYSVVSWNRDKNMHEIVHSYLCLYLLNLTPTTAFSGCFFIFSLEVIRVRHYIDVQDLYFIKLSVTLLVTERGRFFPQCNLPLVTLEPRLMIYIIITC